MRALTITIDRYDARRFGLDVLPLDCITLGGRKWMLQIPYQRVVRWRQAPLDQRSFGHRRKIANPRNSCSFPHFKIREISRAGESSQSDPPFLNTTLQIVDDECRLV